MSLLYDRIHLPYESLHVSRTFAADKTKAKRKTLTFFALVKTQINDMLRSFLPGLLVTRVQNITR